jgi:hypothetical protein
MKYVQNAVWLLCALIVAACLDRLPDPPAINPSRIDARVLCLGNQLVSSTYDQPDRVVDFAGSYSAVQYPVLEYVLQPSLLVYRSSVIRQAADPSPPQLVS